MNDINILDSSTIVERILHGQMLPSFDHIVNGRSRKLCYYLVDGIYPHWAIFIKSIVEATTKKHKCFSRAQEALRKDVKRAFGVLLSRWHLLAKPCALWDRKLMFLTMKAAIILHNMILEWRRDGYVSEMWSKAEISVEQGLVIDSEGNEKPFTWKKRGVVSGGTTTVSDEQ